MGDESAADEGGSDDLPDEADAAIPEDDLRWCCCIQDCVICDASSSLAFKGYYLIKKDK